MSDGMLFGNHTRYSIVTAHTLLKLISCNNKVLAISYVNLVAKTAITVKRFELAIGNLLIRITVYRERTASVNMFKAPTRKINLPCVGQLDDENCHGCGRWH